VLTTTDINGGTVDGTTIGATTPSTVVATQVDITAQGDLRLQDTTGGQYVALQAPGTIATSYTLTLPVDDGTSGQALITDGSGVLSWSSAASGDVYGPASATDNAVARYDGTTGKIIQNSAVTIGDDGATVIAANSTSDGLRITQVGSGNALVVEDSANPDATPFVVDASGRLVLGYTTTVLGSQLENYGVTDNLKFSADATGQFVRFFKSRSASAATPWATTVNSGDVLGVFDFYGADGTNPILGARITAQVDGTPGTNDMPGRLVLSTTRDGASSPTEAVRIDNQGRVMIGGDISTDVRLRVGGTFTSTTSSVRGIRVFGTIPSSITSDANMFESVPQTQAASFTLTNLRHFYANSAVAFGAGSTVTNQVGFEAQSSLTGATNNFGFYGNIASGTGRWNFYANG
jgi:hypothetical protein